MYDAIYWGIKRMLRLTGAREHTVYLSGPNNFRCKIDPIRPDPKDPTKLLGYKANRDGMEKPYHYANITDYLINMHEAVVTDGAEADDYLAIEQTTINAIRRNMLPNLEPYKSVYSSKGQEIKVSECDYEFASKYLWSISKSGYAYRGNQNGAKYERPYLHSELLGLNDEQYGDHINGDRLDNRRTNLRVVTNQQNSWNRDKVSGRYRGVNWDHTRNKWIAGITVDGKRTALGRFDSEEEAARVYDKKSIELFGQYARPNFLPEETIIASIDKDLKQVPGWHFDIVKEKLVHVDELEAARNFYSQMLQGDRTDNISGIRGIGPVKADKTVNQFFSEDALSDHIYRMYVEQWGEDGERMFNMNWDLLRLARTQEELDDVIIRYPTSSTV